MILSVMGSLFSKGINLITNIISVPLLLTYLGNERYGMFAMVTSLLGFMTFSDLGLSLGLQNRIPEYREKEDKSIIQKAISSTFFTLFSIAILLFFVLFFANNFINWANFFNVQSEIAKVEASSVAWAFFFCFLISLPFNTVYSVINGNQEAYISEIWRSFGNLLCIILLYVAVFFKGNTAIFTLIMYGSISITTLAAFCYIFGKTRKNWQPRWSLWDKNLVKLLFKDGIIYFVLQIFTIGLTTVDSFFIAKQQGSESVTTFMVGLRLIVIVSLPLTLINGQILPALNDAIAKTDTPWIKKNLRKALFINSVYVVLMSLVLFLFGDLILELWVKNMVKMDKNLWIGFILLFAFMVYNSLISNILLSPKFLRYTLYAFPISIVLMVTLKWLLLVNYGLAAMLAGGSILMIAIYLIPSLLKFKKINYL
jgi:O-antigen/teichoic acid export membrane protein